MINTYLARVTECVHQHLFCTFTDCPGGSVTRIEPDWAAAAKEVGMIVRGVLGFGVRSTKHDSIDTKLEGHWAGRIVGAALGEG